MTLADTSPNAFGNALGYSIAEGSGQTAGSTAASQQAQPPLEIQQQAMAAGHGPLTPEAAVRALAVNNSAAASAPVDTRTYAADIDDIRASDAAIGQYEVTPGQTLFHLQAQADTWRVVEGQIAEAAQIEAQSRAMAQLQADAAQVATAQNQRHADNTVSWRALERQPLTSSVAADIGGNPIVPSEPGPYLQYSIGTSRRADPDGLARNKEYRLSQLDAVGAHAAQRGDTWGLHRNAIDYTLTSMLQYGSPTEFAVGLFGTIAGPVIAGPLINAAGRFSPSVFPGYAAANAEFGAAVSATSTFVTQSVNSIGRELGDVTQRVLGDILEPAWAKQYLIPPGTAANAAERSPLLTRYLEETGGRWGSAETRLQNHQIATQYETSGARIAGGAGRSPEEWIPGPGGGTKGGSFVDITIRSGKSTIRVQTVTTIADGVTPTITEAAAAARIRAAFPNDQLILVPKVKK